MHPGVCLLKETAAKGSATGEVDVPGLWLQWFGSLLGPLQLGSSESENEGLGRFFKMFKNVPLMFVFPGQGFLVP